MKMQGLGNDFLVVDERRGGAPWPKELVRALADRRRGVGFDQLAVIESDDGADARLIFYNSDGSTSETCGNATRCIARHLMDETGASALKLRTGRGVLDCEDAGDGLTRVNMGRPSTDWREIPIAENVDTLHLPIDGDPVATGLGNPHCTFFVDDADSVDLAARGPQLERHPLFPERANVQFVQVIGPDRLRMRVWERGAGITLSSGSSSCAAVAAAARRGLTGRRARVAVDGGEIGIDWRDDGIWMTGPAQHVYSGTLTAAFLESV